MEIVEGGDSVIVETARGVEFGHVIVGPKEVTEQEIIPPLKKRLLEWLQKKIIGFISTIKKKQ